MLGCESRVRRPQAPCTCSPTHRPPHPMATFPLRALKPQLHPARIASFLALFTEQQVEEWGLAAAAQLPSHLLPLPPG